MSLRFNGRALECSLRVSRRSFNFVFFLFQAVSYENEFQMIQIQNIFSSASECQAMDFIEWRYTCAAFEFTWSFEGIT